MPHCWRATPTYHSHRVALDGIADLYGRLGPAVAYAGQLTIDAVADSRFVPPRPGSCLLALDDCEPPPTRIAAVVRHADRLHIELARPDPLTDCSRCQPVPDCRTYGAGGQLVDEPCDLHLGWRRADALIGGRRPLTTAAPTHGTKAARGPVFTCAQTALAALWRSQRPPGRSSAVQGQASNGHAGRKQHSGASRAPDDPT